MILLMVMGQWLLISKNGGILAHLGTDDIKEVVKMIGEGNKKAQVIYDAMIYQIAKQIGAMYVALKANCSAIILTGGIANDEYYVKKLSKYINKLAKVVVMPGEFELGSYQERKKLKVILDNRYLKDYRSIYEK